MADDAAANFTLDPDVKTEDLEQLNNYLSKTSEFGEKSKEDINDLA